jgi:GT2 family glycosyltransferase/glycosyltransferase involved in cell wall biosynthesis
MAEASKEGTKDRLGAGLSLASKLFLKRVFVRTVFACVRLVAILYGAGRRVVEAAAARGLNVGEAWNVAPRLAPAEDFAPSFGVSDFLFLTDALAARKQDAPQNDDDARKLDRVPRASIIIPVFNKAEFTFQCLRSLVREINFEDTEIIVVNNASTDETDELLARFNRFVRVVRNEENRGFVDACNQGAAEARGQYLVFLNNDAVVHAGWLEELIATVEADETIGAVGSMFLYPDGRVQEAGAIVWRDGSAFHYGWGGSADDPRYAFARDVDYCSGASLLIRRDLFERLGGFDRRFAPAYYEDVDLCFGVRAAGLRVRYQPLSRVTHFEGATAGRDASTGFKRFQVIHRETFRAKWRDVLDEFHFANDTSNVARASSRASAPRVIVFDDHTPAPDRDAGSGRMAFILSSLARWTQPVFISTGKVRSPEHERRLWREGVETASAADYPRLVRRRDFRAAIVSRPDVAEAIIPRLRRLSPHIKIVFDMVDVHFIRLEREAHVTNDRHTANEAARYREIETRLARSSDLVWCNSEDDKRAMQTLAPNVRIEVIPTIHTPHARGLAFDARRDLLFLGNLAHPPNRDAVRYFVEEIFPLVRDQLFDARLSIVGDNVPAEIKAYASDTVRVLGYVPDIEPLFAASRVMIAPLRFGAGVKGKIGESLAHGLPVVTTSIGAEGMGFTDGEEVLIADDPRAFASAVARAYTDAELWQKLSDAGFAHVARGFSPEVVRHVVNDSLRETIGLDATRDELATSQLTSRDTPAASEPIEKARADAGRVT